MPSQAEFWKNDIFFIFCNWYEFASWFCGAVNSTIFRKELLMFSQELQWSVFLLKDNLIRLETITD